MIGGRVEVWSLWGHRAPTLPRQARTRRGLYDGRTWVGGGAGRPGEARALSFVTGSGMLKWATCKT